MTKIPKGRRLVPSWAERQRRIGELRLWILASYRPRPEFGIVEIGLEFMVTNREIRLTFEALEQGGYIEMPAGLIATLAGTVPAIRSLPRAGSCWPP